MTPLNAETQALLDSLPDGALWCEGDVIARGNAMAAALLGETVASLTGHPIWEYCHPDDVTRLRSRLRDRREGIPVPSNYEIDIVRRDGTRARVEIIPRLLQGSALLILLRDRQTQAYESRLLVALSQVAEKVQRARSVKAALDIAVEGLKAQGIILHVGRILDHQLVPQVAPSDDPLLRLVEAVTGLDTSHVRLPIASLTIGDSVIVEQRDLYIDDLAGLLARYLRRWPNALAPVEEGALAGKGYGQGMVAPLVVDGRTWGVMLFGSDRLTRSEAASLRLFTAQLSSALEVAEAFERLQRSHRQVEAIQAVMEAGTDSALPRLVPALLDIACAATSSAVAALYLVEGTGLIQSGFRVGSEAFAARIAPRLPIDAPLLDHPTTLDGARWTGWKEPLAPGATTEHLELLPLRIQGRLEGLLVLGRDARAPYGADELRTGELLADQIAVQMEKARLLRDARDRVDELDLLLEVGRVVTESLEPDRILDVAMTSLERMLGCDQAFVWIHDVNLGNLRGAACADPKNRSSFVNTRLRLDEPSGAVQAMLSGAAVRINDAAGSHVVHQPLRELYALRSVLVLPLLHRDEAIGAISVADTQRERTWTDSEVERATVIARQLAVAMANARLFEDLRRSYDDLARTQAELVKRERLAALGELAAVVAHEVRNPLGVIFNSVSSLKRSVLPGPNAEMLLGIVSEEADRLNRIVGDLLDFARPHEPELRLEVVSPLLLSARDAVLNQAGPGISISVEAEPGLIPVQLDSRMLRQALINLMANAIQAMPKGGVVEVQAARSKHGTRPGLRLAVRDTGPGIAAGTVDRIFQPFFTTKAMGTGLGLAVVKRIVDAHHGEVTVDSRDGVGTTFTVWLPE